MNGLAKDFGQSLTAAATTGTLAGGGEVVVTPNVVLMTRSLVGTDEYLAPEMIAGSKVWNSMMAEGKGRAGASGTTGSIVSNGTGSIVSNGSGIGGARAIPIETAASLSLPPLVPSSLLAYAGYNQSVDFWALGALLYEMLTGK